MTTGIKGFVGNPVVEISRSLKYDRVETIGCKWLKQPNPGKDDQGLKRTVGEGAIERGRGET
jgi:hypothetical protein